MPVVLTAEEILNSGQWDRFCAQRGINPWAINEGLMDKREEFVFSDDEYQMMFGLSTTPSTMTKTP